VGNIVPILFLILIFGLPITAIAKAPDDWVVDRKIFAKWTLVYVFVPVIGFFTVVPMATINEETYRGFAWFWALAFVYPFYTRLACRARHAGISKKWSFLSVLPLLNFLFVFFLLFKGKKSLTKTSTELSPVEHAVDGERIGEINADQPPSIFWWRLSHPVRISIFISAIWLPSWTVYVFAFEPYGYGASQEEWMIMIGAGIGLPIVLVSIVSAYMKLIVPGQTPMKER
jgi:hypothetical protein